MRITPVFAAFLSLTRGPSPRTARSQIPLGQRHRQEQGKTNRDPKQHRRLCVRRCRRWPSLWGYIPFHRDRPLPPHRGHSHRTSPTLQ